MSYPLEGVFVATVTPFEESGAVDLPTLETHLHRLAQTKIAGFVPVATTGEEPTLLPHERKQVLELTTRVATQHGLQILAGCGSNSTAAALIKLQEAAELGATAALVVTPYYNRPTQAGCLAHYRFLADRSPIPLILYNVPGRTNVMLSPETIFSLLSHPNIVGLKEASGNYGHWLALAQGWRDPAKRLLAGDDDAFAPLLALGACGIISASANLVPDRFVELYRQAQAGEWKLAFASQIRLAPLIQALFNETSPAPLKYALHRLGRGENRVRLPLVEASPETQRRVDEAMGQLEVLR